MLPDLGSRLTEAQRTKKGPSTWFLLLVLFKQTFIYYRHNRVVKVGKPINDLTCAAVVPTSVKPPGLHAFDLVDTLVSRCITHHPIGQGTEAFGSEWTGSHAQKGRL